jgi:hypothetical protein
LDEQQAHDTARAAHMQRRCGLTVGAELADDR